MPSVILLRQHRATDTPPRHFVGSPFLMHVSMLCPSPQLLRVVPIQCFDPKSGCCKHCIAASVTSKCRSKLRRRSVSMALLVGLCDVWRLELEERLWVVYWRRCAKASASFCSNTYPLHASTDKAQLILLHMHLKLFKVD
jgi:hypothetical protein